MQPDFVLVSRWHIGAPVQAVWGALADPQGWPLWWPYVRRVRLLRHGNAEDIGSLRRIEWGSALGYGITLDVTTMRIVKPREIEGHAVGDLEGVGFWRVEADGDATRATYRWAVNLRRPWMRRLLPLLRPVFAWNHHAVMRAGAHGLSCHLAAPLIACAAG